MTSGRKKRRLRNLLTAFVLVALAGAGTAAVMFSSWSEVSYPLMGAGEANFNFDIVRRRLGEPPFVIIESGKVTKRDIAPSDAMIEDIDRLNLMTWDEDAGRLVTMRFPLWFVKLKTTDSINVGTMVGGLATGWDDLDLSITTDDLERLGPTIIVDHRRENGSRVLMWTDAGR